MTWQLKHKSQWWTVELAGERRPTDRRKGEEGKGWRVAKRAEMEREREREIVGEEACGRECT